MCKVASDTAVLILTIVSDLPLNSIPLHLVTFCSVLAPYSDELLSSLDERYESLKEQTF